VDDGVRRRPDELGAAAAEDSIGGRGDVADDGVAVDDR
jgi:hypothetical protein